MGVVIKQSFWGTVIAYLGVAVGYLNTLYFRAEYLTLEQIGLFTLVTAHAMMISPLAGLGMSSSYLKFFPVYKEEQKNKFFTVLFLVVMGGNAIALLSGFLLKDVITERYDDSAPEYINFLFVTGIVIISNSLFELFYSYSRSIMKVVFPSFIRDIYLRIGSLFLIIGFAFEWWTYNTAVYGLGVIYLLAFILLLSQLMLFHDLRFDFKFSAFDKEWSRKVARFAGYSMLLAGGFALYNNATYDQVTAYLGSDAMGIFQTCFFIAVIVEMPRRNMTKVMAPLISKEFHQENFKELRSIYKRSSITMTILGLLLFLGIATNLHDLFDFIPKGEAFRKGFWVVIIVCFAKLSIMVSSFGGAIIGYSPYYKYNLLFQAIATILLIALNYFFIPLYGLNGAAFSFFIATLIQIILQITFVKIKFEMVPWTKRHLFLLIISFIVGVLSYLIQTPWHPVLTIGIRSIFTTAAFTFLIYYFKISEDINKLIRSTFERFLKVNI